MEEETLLKDGGKKQKISGGFTDNNRTTTNTGGGGDRLSALPDSLLISILSILPIKNTAATSVLSRRWRHLWTQNPNLTFNSCFFPPSGNFFATVDHILRQLNSPNSIKTFTLDFHETKTEKTQIIPSFLDSWVPPICGRNVEEIEVSLLFCRKIEPSQLPNCVFQCQSLVKLSLCGSIYCKLPDNGVVSLNNLKELEISSVKMEIQLAKKLFESCPKLETLSLNLDTLEEGEGEGESERRNRIIDVDIFGPCLKSLCFSGFSKRFKFVIDAPNLEDISLRGTIANYCFVSKPIGLRNADIGPKFVGRGGDYRSLVLELLWVFSSVRKITLYDLTLFEALDCMKNDVVWSLVPNLVELSMACIYESEMNSDAPIPAWLLGQLKKVQVHDLVGLDDEIKFVGYILSHANILEELRVSISKVDDLNNEECERSQLWREYDFCRQLFTFPRCSPTCHIEFRGEYISGSSDNYRDGLLVLKPIVYDPNCGVI